MHLEIEDLYFDGDRVGINFEYDEEFKRKVAQARNVSYLSKKDLQIYIVEKIKDVISSEEFLDLKKQLED